MRYVKNTRFIFGCLAVLSLTGPLAFGQKLAADKILTAYRPANSDIEFDTPEAAEMAQCRAEIERGDGFAGYVVYGPSGQVLRRFHDTDGDNNADVFRYYRMGLEVYRDIDTNKNGKPDQHRWMNWGGTRWGIDKNEDGKVDSWKILSAQECARVAVDAMIKSDIQTLSTVMLSADDIRTLKVTQSVGKKLQESGSDLTNKLRSSLAASKVINTRTKFVRFDPPLPGLIPADEGIASNDLTVYENAMAIVQNGERHDLVMIGEMVRVGSVWKLTQVPTALEGNGPQTVQLGGVLMQPRLSGDSPADAGMSEAMQGILTELQKVDENSPAADATPKQLAAYNVSRADLIEKLVAAAPNDKERVQWIRQFADGLSAAVQTGEYADGLQRLVQLQSQVKTNEDLMGYVWYRRLLAEYAYRLKPEDDEARQKAQSWWLEQLEVYARRWPKSEDAADAIVQLAISLELMGRLDDAKAWYQRLATDYERSNAGIRARGAMKRLSLTGNRLQLSGKTMQGQPLSADNYRGRVTLVVFWATWAVPFTDDLPELNQIYARYKGNGFDILGVNLDANADAIPPYVRQHKIAWQSIRDAGGTDGQLAREFGIVSVPTMFVVDKSGIVAGGITTENLDFAVKTLLQGKNLEEAARQSSAAVPAPKQ
jgi:thiol-disulfide isomerase/thioredoxin